MTDKTQTRSIRLPNDVCEYIDTIKIREVIEDLYAKVQTGRLDVTDDGEIRLNNDLSRFISDDIIADFRVILNIYDTDFPDFFKALYKKVESGEIDVDEIMK